MSSISERIADGSLMNGWTENFWTVLRDGEEPTKEFLVKPLYGNLPAVQSHSIAGIMSFLLNDAYFDEDDEMIKVQMRLAIVKPLYQAMTASSNKCRITYGAAVLFDNTELPPYAKPEEAAELEDMEWVNEEPYEFNIFNERTMIQTMIANEELAVMERADVFVLRANAEFRKAKEGHCATCRYFSQDEKGTFCGADLRNVGPDAPIAKVCVNFSPRPKKPVKPTDRYVLIEPDMVYLPPFTADALFRPEDLNGDWMEDLRKEMYASGEKFD